MSVRGVVIDGDGAILRTVVTAPELLAIQIGDGESLFQVTEDTGAFIDDAVVVVSDAGSFAVAEGAPEGSSAPDLPIELVAF